MRIAFLVCLLLSAGRVGAAADDVNDPDGATDKPVERSKLPGHPEPAARATLDALRKMAWMKSGIRNILGRGSDQMLQFSGADDHLKLQTTIRHYFSVNEKRKPNGLNFEEETIASECTVAGPLLQRGNHRQTFALVPAKRLVLNAVVPVGEREWLYVSSTVFGIGPDAPFHESEMRFKFADDPLKADEGKGVLRLSSDNGKDKAVREIPVRFTLDAKTIDGRRVNVVANDDKKTKWAQLVFAPSGEYALILDLPNRNSEVFDATAPAADK